jgi:hypothetical protein
MKPPLRKQRGIQSSLIRSIGAASGGESDPQRFNRPSHMTLQVVRFTLKKSSESGFRLFHF